MNDLEKRHTSRLKQLKTKNRRTEYFVSQFELTAKLLETRTVAAQILTSTILRASYICRSTNVNCLATSLNIDDLFGVNVYFDKNFLPSKSSNSFDHEERDSKMQMSFAIETNKNRTSSLAREKLNTGPCFALN